MVLRYSNTEQLGQLFLFLGNYNYAVIKVLLELDIPENFIIVSLLHSWMTYICLSEHPVSADNYQS